MKSWSATFVAYLDENGITQTRVARELKVPQSAVSYWCRGATPRDKMCARIKRWSKGGVPLPDRKLAKARSASRATNRRAA